MACNTTETSGTPQQAMLMLSVVMYLYLERKRLIQAVSIDQNTACTLIENDRSKGRLALP